MRAESMLACRILLLSAMSAPGTTHNSTQLSPEARLAQQFASAQCRKLTNAIPHHRWRSLCSTMQNGKPAPLCNLRRKAVEMRLGVAPNGRLISYARNQKAASTVLWDHFPQLFVPRQQSRASLWSSIRQWIMNPRGRASISQARRGDCIVENTSDINGVVIANVEEPNRSLCQRCEQQRESGSAV